MSSKQQSHHETVTYLVSEKVFERFAPFPSVDTNTSDKTYGNYKILKVWNDNDPYLCGCSDLSLCFEDNVGRFYINNSTRVQTDRHLTWTVCTGFLWVEFGFERRSGLQFGFGELR